MRVGNGRIMAGKKRLDYENEANEAMDEKGGLWMRRLLMKSCMIMLILLLSVSGFGGITGTDQSPRSG